VSACCFRAGDLSSECTRATLDHCESMAPSTSAVDGNWTVTDIDSFCRYGSQPVDYNFRIYLDYADGRLRTEISSWVQWRSVGRANGMNSQISWKSFVKCTLNFVVSLKVRLCFSLAFGPIFLSKSFHFLRIFFFCHYTVYRLDSTQKNCKSLANRPRGLLVDVLLCACM